MNKRYYAAAASLAMKAGSNALADEILHAGMQAVADDLSRVIEKYPEADRPIVLAAMTLCAQAIRTQMPEPMQTGADLLIKTVKSTIWVDLDKVKGDAEHGRGD